MYVFLNKVISKGSIPPAKKFSINTKFTEFYWKVNEPFSVLYKYGVFSSFYGKFLNLFKFL